MSLVKRCAFVVAGGWACLAVAGGVRADDQTSASVPKWGPWAEAGGYVANRADANRGEAALWAPLMQGSSSVLFTDIRAKLYNDDQQEGNLAIGYREMLTDGWNLGIWAGYDRRLTNSGMGVGQIAAGVEALSPNWDFRVSGYLPLDDAKTVASTISGTGATTLELVDDSLYLITAAQTRTELAELAFRGVDAEIGVRVPLGQGPESGADLRIFLGGYYFENDAFAEAITGPRLRAELRFNDILPDWEGSRLTFDAAYSNDSVRDDEIGVGARLRLPLGGGAVGRKLTGQEQRMAEGLRRDPDVVTQTQTRHTMAVPAAREHVEDVATGVDLLHAIIVSNGGDLQDAIDGVGVNSLIVALGGGAEFDVIAMAENQTLLGGGGSIEVRGLTTGALATYTAPGTQPTIFIPGQVTGYAAEITTANNSHVSNVTIQADFDPDVVNVLVGSNQTVVLDHLNIDNGLLGVYVDGSNSNVTLRDSTLLWTKVDIRVGSSGNTVVADNNVFGADYNVVDFFNGSGSNDFTISNNTFIGYSGYLNSYLFRFFNGSVTVQPGSIGNISYIDWNEGGLGYCYRENATFTGFIGFTTPPTIVTQDTCAIAP